MKKCPRINECGYTHNCSHAVPHNDKSEELCRQFCECPCPCREPPSDHPGFEERWLENEAAAKKGDKPPPDQSRLLAPDKILDIKSDVKASDFQSLKELAEGIDQALVSAQRDLTAKIVRDEWRVKASDLVAMRAEIAEKKCTARIEALIEWGNEVCTEHSVEIRKKLHKTLEELGAEKPWFPRHSCDECWQGLKATHTSKAGESHEASQIWLPPLDEGVMKIDKAIEILTDLTHLGFARTFSTQDAENAHKLGIEALKVVQSNRIYGYPNKIPRLPGEAE